MNTEDIVYLCLLFFSMGFGIHYRTIQNPDIKRKVGALVGLVIVFVVSGLHAIHPVISTLINACIILYTDKRKCHIYSFAFSFLYLFFFRTTIYFGIPYPPSHTNLVQMMLTLKLIVLILPKKKRDLSEKTEEEKYEDKTCDINLEFLDVFYYAFNYCGVLTGPYFRYRTFVDHLYKPYYKYDNYKEPVLKRLRYIPILGAIYIATNYCWPLSYLSTDEFHHRSFLYRYWYIWPSFLIFRTRIYLGLTLTEIVCIFGGLGVYPKFSNPKSGQGPTENLKKLSELTDSVELKKLEYDYENDPLH
ncbi:hypothetical protein NQ318_016674 [Aromia moschata]|uniref:Lysophospholipid acyltransferase 7 n=1 Tax=Aromia moschata TaxID=1265417 RepID=A0AAV8Y3S3_9CUCU|nr:hypothetical protein NQ318_016674 [Aromia moschata]